MHYDFTAITETETPRAVEPQWQHVVDTYVSECNKTSSMWRAVPAECLDFRPHERVNTIHTIFTHQLLSERRFFAEFVGTEELPANELLPPDTDGSPTTAAYLDRYIALCKRRLPQFAAGTTSWWLEPRPFFGGLERQRIWIFWRRVLHTCHHRTQVQTWLRLAGQHVPTIYGPSGDVSWSDADPTYSVAAASRSAKNSSSTDVADGRR